MSDITALLRRFKATKSSDASESALNKAANCSRVISAQSSYTSSPSLSVSLWDGCCLRRLRSYDHWLCTAGVLEWCQVTMAGYAAAAARWSFRTPPTCSPPPPPRIHVALVTYWWSTPCAAHTQWVSLTDSCHADCRLWLCGMTRV